MYYYNIFIQIQQEQTIGKEEIALILYVTGVVVVFFIMVVVFFVTFQKRKTKLLQDNFAQQQVFDSELQQTQQDIQEQTLNDISRELHDNVGQLLAFASMQLNAVKKTIDENAESKINSAASAVTESFEEVRALSKSLNGDVIFNLGFDTTVKNEITRLNKSGLIEAECAIQGEPVPFKSKKHQIILFRIFQEFIFNTLKYAEATMLSVRIGYKPKTLTLHCNDNGLGFDMDAVVYGAGVINMKKRAKDIDAVVQLESHPNAGTTLIVVYTL